MRAGRFKCSIIPALSCIVDGRENALVIVLAVAAISAVMLMRSISASQAQQQAPAATATVLLMFGHGAKSAERWDGAVSVTGGTLVRTEGRHFSAGDAISGPGSWKCVT